MIRLRPSMAMLVAMVALSCTSLRAADFDRTTLPVGKNRDGVLMTPTNQTVRSAGKVIDLPGMRPQAVALSPDGKVLVVSGHTHELVVMDPASGDIRQRVPLPGAQAPGAAVSSLILHPDERAQLSLTGLVFSPDGSRIYLSNVNGDIKVFAVDRQHQVEPAGSLALPEANVPLRKAEIPAGLAVSADGKSLFVVGNLSNQLFQLDVSTGQVRHTWPVGVAPYDVVLAAGKAYVSNWGGRRPSKESVTGPAGRGTLVRVDDRSIAYEGSLSIIDLAKPADQPPRELLMGPHTGAMALSPNGRWLVIASTGSDTLSVVDTRRDEVVDKFTTRQNPGDPFGAQPNALAFDKRGHTLFCANGTQNAVAVFAFRPHGSAMRGLIPAGWYPGALAFDARHKTLLVANIKDIGTKPEPARQAAKGSGFNTWQFAGSLSLVPVPSKSELARFTAAALADLRYPLLQLARLPAREGLAPVPVPERVGEPSVFRHVIYVIKENRTYDQVLGDVAEGNGAPDLCIFGEHVTPNLHRLVREFALLDNTYCSGVLSADGHQWTDTGIATDYVERQFAGWPRSYPSGGSGLDAADALAYSPAGFIWNNALAHGCSVADFGEFTTATKRWTDPKRTGAIGFPEVWHDMQTGAHAITYHCEPDVEALRPYIMTNTIGWELDVPDQWRADRFIESLHQFEQADNMPALTILWLPNDHTSGTRHGSPTPAAQVADNDLAVGRVVEAVSHSRFWRDTCVFVIEDDPQNGWDHVSGYRTTAYVISAYTRRHAVVHTQYNQPGMLRTMELILGLPPMNQMDATATPMFDCFTPEPDFTPFTAVPNQVPLDQMNPAPPAIPDHQRRKDAKISANLPLARPDQCNEDTLNRILWRAMKQDPYPAWAVHLVDDDD